MSRNLWYSYSKLSNTGFAFVSEMDGERFTTTLDRSTDTISYHGYVQPGYYRLLTFNRAEGFSVDSTAAVVENVGGRVFRPRIRRNHCRNR